MHLFRRCVLLCLPVLFLAPQSLQGQTVARASDSTHAPVIGIASLSDPAYIRAVRDAGGTPVVLPNTDGSTDNIKAYLKILDGLLMPGGADIPPSEWNEKPHPTTKVLDDDRYRFERALISAWISETDKPLLGVCLGCQWINVASGGSLVQDIPSEYGVNHRGTSHKINVQKDSRLGDILGDSNLEVNSNHHQAVRRLGQGLRIVARSHDGIVEAIEGTDTKRFVLGVQWHPERMQEHRSQQDLIKAFVKACIQ